MFELILTICLFGLMTWSAWAETIWIAGVAATLYFCLSWLFGDLSYSQIIADPVTLVSVTASFAAIGALWSLWKWRRWMLSDKVQVALRKGKEAYDGSYGESLPFKESSRFPKEARPSQNTDRIITWIALWPFSMVTYFFADFLMDVGRWIYNRLGKVYQHITDGALPEDMR